MRDAAAWAQLLPVAMVGTDRHAAALPQWPGPVGAAIAALAGAERGDGDRVASDVLRTAGILAVCGLAGARPQARPQGLADACAPDTAPSIDDPALLQWLTWTLREGPDRLKQAFLLRIAQAGLRLPHGLLPQALELARSSLALRPLIQPLLGERGVWLARQRDEWQFAAGVAGVDAHDPRQWDEGTLEQRKAFLAAERARDPRAARERLVAALPELPARERAELARGLATGLSMDDEPLLEQLRNDRGQDVRALALELLLRLPDAAHPRRAAARVAALMSRGGLLTGRRWTIAPPGEAADDWKADQVDPVAPQGGPGQRAWWLYQLVRQVPLSWWTAQLATDARGVAAWAQSHEWGEALWRGWRDVLRRAPAAGWAELLLDAAEGLPRWSPGADPADRALALTQVTPAVRERWVLRQLASSDESPVAAVWAALSHLEAGEPVAPALVEAVISRVRRTMAVDTAADPGLHNANIAAQERVAPALPSLCCALPLPALAAFEDWSRCPTDSRGVETQRQLGRQIIQARRALANILP